MPGLQGWVVSRPRAEVNAEELQKDLIQLGEAHVAKKRKKEPKKKWDKEIKEELAKELIALGSFRAFQVCLMSSGALHLIFALVEASWRNPQTLNYLWLGIKGEVWIGIAPSWETWASYQGGRGCLGERRHLSSQEGCCCGP
jgi:hypothetical protein